MKKNILLLALLISVISLAINFNKIIDKDISIIEPSNRIVEIKNHKSPPSLTNHSNFTSTILLNSDYDEDGVLDDVDLDSDNDGILDLTEVSNCTTPTFRKSLYFQNFGTSTSSIRTTSLSGNEGTSGLAYKTTNPTSDGTYSLTYNTTLVDDFGVDYNDQWSIEQNTADNANLGNGYNDHTVDANGLMAVFNPINNTSVIWQSPNIIVKPGAAIEVSLWLMRLNLYNNNPNLTIQLVNAANNTNIGAPLITGPFNSRSIWEKKSIIIPKGTNTLARSAYIRITSSINSGQGNDFALDDITIDELYCDSDNDGIPDYLDLDSDNDGCPDAIEGSDRVKRNELRSNGAISIGSNGGVGKDTNNLGVPNLVNPGGYADQGSQIGQLVGSATNTSISNCTTIDATNDNFTNSSINNTNGGIIGNVALRDYLNSDLQNDKTLTELENTFTFSLSNNPLIPGAVLLPNGNLQIPNGTPAGVYRLSYTMCLKADSTICDNALIIVEVNLDSDGDGISNNVDLDDDNDGILDTVESSICDPSSIVTYYSENFGTGSRTSFNLYNPLISTSYTYEPNTYTDSDKSTNLNDEEYAVVPNLNDLGEWSLTVPGPNGNAWVTTDDHTPSDTNGRMAVFNASRSFEKDMINFNNITVPEYTVIKISFWAKNLDKSPENMDQTWDINRALPSILFELADSDDLFFPFFSFTTGTIPRDEQWHQYTAYVNTKDFSSISITMKNIIEGGNGNDVAIDDIKITSICDTDNDGAPNEIDNNSDGDDCPDAIEGAGTIMYKDLKENNTINSTVDINGVPTPVNGGQGIGNAYLQSNDDCKCLKSPNTNTVSALSTNVGITTVSKDLDWPQKIKGAFIALESKSKGFTINRLTTLQINAITNPTEGMLVYDININCLKVYSKKHTSNTFEWHCFDFQSCPDN